MQKKLVLILVGLVVLILLALRGFAPLAIEKLALNALEKSTYLTGSIDRIALHLVRGEIQFHGLGLRHKELKLIDIETIAVEWNWRPLLDGVVEIASVRIINSTGNLQLIEGNPAIGSTKFSELVRKTKAEPSQSSAPPLRFVVGSALVENLLLTISSEEQPSQLHVQSLSLNKIDLTPTLDPMTLDLKAELNNRPLQISGSLHRQDESLPLIFQIKSSNLDLERLVTMIPAGDPAVRSLKGQLSLDLSAELDLDQTLPMTHLRGSIQLEQFSMTPEGQAPLSFSALQLKEFDLKFSDSIEFNAGILDITDLRLNRKQHPEETNVRLSQLSIIHGPLDAASPMTTFQSNIGKKGNFFTQLTWKRGEQNLVAMKVESKVENIDLGDYSGFFVDQIGYRIEHGYLGGTLKTATNDKQEVEGLLELNFNHLKVDATNTKGDPIESKIGIPLASSLALIEDEDSQFTLKFPIKGRIDDPDFSVRLVLQDKLKGILLDHLTSSIGNAVVTSYLPMLASTLVINPATAYSLLRKGSNWLAKLPFEPIRFAPGATTLDNNAREQLDKVSKVLQDRPNVSLIFCPSAYPDHVADQDNISETEIKETLTTANRRLDAAVNYVTSKKGVAARQVIPCQPKLSKDDSKQGLLELRF